MRKSSDIPLKSSVTFTRKKINIFPQNKVLNLWEKTQIYVHVCIMYLVCVVVQRTSRLPLLEGFRMRNFLSKFSQSVDMQKGILYFPRSTRSLSSWRWTRGMKRLLKSSVKHQTQSFFILTSSDPVKGKQPHMNAQAPSRTLSAYKTVFNDRTRSHRNIQVNLMWRERAKQQHSLRLHPQMTYSSVKQVLHSLQRKLVSISKSYD